MSAKSHSRNERLLNLVQGQQFADPSKDGMARSWAAKLANDVELRAFFSQLSEVERRALFPEVARLHKLANSISLNWVDDNMQQTPRHLPDPWSTSTALMATATLSELKAIRWWGVASIACAVLADRRPSWLAEWAELALERAQFADNVGELGFALREWVKNGWIDAPQHERYAVGLPYQYHYNQNEAHTLIQQLRNDLPLVEDLIWRQFELEGGGEISLANFDQYYDRRAGTSWANALKTLSEDQLLDRQRLLDASLDALKRGFQQYRAGWFSRFHEALAPTIDERAARVERYIDLLSSQISPTVSMAMAALKTLQKAKRLDVGASVDRVAPALMAKSAATAKAAISLLANVAKSSPELRADIARTAASVFEHANSDVQAAGLTVIEALATDLDEAAQAAIADRLGVMSAALRPRAEKLLGASHAAVTPTAANDDEIDIVDLEARAAALPAELRRLAGVDAVFDALHRDAADVPRAVFNGMDVPRLDPNRAITPIATFTELIDEALFAIENPHDLERVERVLAGALRFAADRPADAVVLLAPLAKSMKRFKPNGPDGEDWATPRGALQNVLTAFVNDTVIAVRIAEVDPRAVMLLRDKATAQFIRSKTSVAQLSQPTHQGHWIDPVVLVERSLAAQVAKAPLLGVADQVLALLRLAPDRRDQARKQAGGVTGEWGAALRYALGGDDGFGDTVALWVAAARSRAPFADDAKVKDLLQTSMQGADAVSRLAVHVSYSLLRDGHAYARVALTNDLSSGCAEFGKDGMYGYHQRGPTNPARCLTTVSMADPETLSKLDSYVSGSMRHAGTWAPAMWPQFPEPVFALAALAACMSDGNGYARPANEPLADGLKLILDPDVPVGTMALFMLTRGLNAIDKAAAAATVDALIALIDDGRLDGEALGGAMHSLLMSGLVFGKRWPDRLKEVARSSPLALLVVRRALERSLHPGEPLRALRDVHAWIETLLELSMEAGEAVADPLSRTGLTGFLGSTKAAKPARAVLALAPVKARTVRNRAVVHALEQRVSRAERWLATED
jgi:hypothetical protein